MTTPLDPRLPDAVELRHLRYFIALAEELHFGRAAARLGIAQPPLSNQIAQLERAVGHPLFTRKPRVALTEPGRALLTVARRALAQVREGIETTRRAGRGETGTLTAGFAASTMLTRIPEAFRAYRASHPGVALVLRELSTSAQLDALKAGFIDVGFLREPVADPAIVGETIVREKYVAVLPPGHVLARRRRIDLHGLANEPFILFPRVVAPALYDQVIALCHAAGFTPRQVQEAQEWLTIVGLVDAGLGISLVPASFQRLGWGGVTYHAIEPAGTTTIAMCRRNEPPAPAAAGFLRIARKVLRGTP
jgi:DNA-binding transcriptional LysR family regulator